MKNKNYAKRKSREQKNISWRHKKLINYCFKDANVLDVGFSNANVAKMITKKKVNYFGIDYNEVMVKEAQSKKLSVKVCDIGKDKIPFKDNFFDLVFASHVIEHIETKEQLHFFKELSRVVKPGGKILVFAPTPFNLFFWDDETHVRPCTHWQLKYLAEDFDFKVIEAKYSQIRGLSNSLQKYFRLPFIRNILKEAYLVAVKK